MPERPRGECPEGAPGGMPRGGPGGNAPRGSRIGCVCPWGTPREKAGLPKKLRTHLPAGKSWLTLPLTCAYGNAQGRLPKKKVLKFDMRLPIRTMWLGFAYP